MTQPTDKIVAAAARKIRQVEAKRIELRRIEEELKALTNEYSAAMRIYGFTPMMMRHACEARGHRFE